MHYRIEAADLHAHLYGVTLTIARPAAGQRVSLPVWIAGSYMVREFAKQITGISARQGSRAVAVHQEDKSSWVIDCQADQALTLDAHPHAPTPRWHESAACPPLLRPWLASAH